MDVLKNLADHFIFIKEGKKILDGTIDDITSDLYKYQIIFTEEIDLAAIKKDIPSVVDSKRVGSIYYIISNREIKEANIKYPHSSFINIDVDIIEAIKLKIGDTIL